jgi:protein phosphatase
MLRRIQKDRIESSRIVKFNGVSCQGSNSIALNLTIILEGMIRKVFILISASNHVTFKQIYEKTLEAVRDVLSEKKPLDLSFVNDRMNGSGGTLVIIDNHYSLATVGGSEAYLFPDKMGLLERGIIGHEGGYFVLCSTPLREEVMDYIASLVKIPRHQSEVTRLVKEKVNDETFSIAIVAVKANTYEGITCFRRLRALSCGSHIGMVRENNEDSCLTMSLCFPDQGGFERRIQALCVADGAGGHGHGEIASREAILKTYYEISRNVVDSPEGGMTNMLNNAILSTNELIMDLRRQMHSNMVTTLTWMIVDGKDAYLGHVGDSRAYVIHEGSEVIEQLTRDHKLVEEMIERGQITRQEAKTHPNRNVITSAIGIDNPRVDTFAIKNKIDNKTSVLLTTDGLTDLVSDHEIVRITNNALTPSSAVKKLIELANERGGYDNISIALLSNLNDNKKA